MPPRTKPLTKILQPSSSTSNAFITAHEGLPDATAFPRIDECKVSKAEQLKVSVPNGDDFKADKKVDGHDFAQFVLFRSLIHPGTLAEALQLSPPSGDTTSLEGCTSPPSPLPSPGCTLPASMSSTLTMRDSHPQNFGHLLPPTKLSSLVSSWLSEDAPSFDGGGYVVGEAPVFADLLLKSSAVLAGRPFVDAVFEELGCGVTWDPQAAEGRKFNLRQGGKFHIATVTGPARLLLLGERVALNALAECSAIASAARHAKEVAKELGWDGRLAGTRKTTPGFRLVQKYGMVVGGMDTHRMDLSGMVMLKDNHISVAGSIQRAVRMVRDVVGFSVKIDVECGSLGDAKEAARVGADVVMLDNFTPDSFKEAAAEMKRDFPHVLVEGSGGITLETIKDYAVPDADVLSFSVNRYVKAIDMSLKIKREE